MKNLPITRAADIADILGNKDSRYCSNGFRNVQFSFSDFAFFEKGLLGNVHVSFSATWSSKEGAQKEPHLGTAEYVAIAFLMTETYLQCSLGFDAKQISQSWVKHLKLTSLPQVEQDSCKSIFLLDKTVADSNHQKRLEIKIGHMKIELTISHPERIHCDLTAFEKADNLKNNFYKTGYKNIDHDIFNVENDFAAMKSSGDIVVKYPERQYSGIGSHYYPTMDMATFILISGQLIQVLVYGLDNLSRGETNNLWLRGLEINYPNPLESGNWREEAECTSFRKVKMKGDVWRVADLQLSLGNIHATFNMTHQLNEKYENENCSIGNAQIEQDVNRVCAVATHRNNVPSGQNDVRMG